MAAIAAILDGRYSGHLGFPIRKILAVFDLQVTTTMLPIEFRVNWLFSLGEEAKNRFSRWLPGWPSWISDRNDFCYFYVQVTPMLPTAFRVNWPDSSGEEAKNRFPIWPPWRPCLISDQNDFSYFLSTSHPDTSFQVSRIGPWVQEKK